MMEESQSQQTGTPQLPVPDGSGHRALPRPDEDGFPASEFGQNESEPVSSSASDLERRLVFADQVHQYIRDYIRQADQKAALFFAVSTAVLAFLYRGGVSSRWLKPVLDWNILDVCAFLAMVILSVSSIISLIVVIPRTPGSRRGYVFWEAIAEYPTGRDYADDLATVTIPTLLQAKSEHCFDLAKVCRSKYWWLRLALWIGVSGLAAAALVFLFVQPSAT
jgi:hypothetical protein